MNYGEEIARTGLKINAIKLNPQNPFTWASGYRMPIYNDNRMFLFYPEYRRLIINALQDMIFNENISFDIIAGTSTAGIPHGMALANRFNCPFIYIRDKPKDHGLRNQIEGIDAESDLSGKRVILIEDLISTGGSSARAVQAIRNANGECNYCLAIFDYGLDKAILAFNSLNPKCEVRSILTYSILLQIAKEIGFLTEDHVRLLEEWRSDPFGWGEKHGFPRIEKSEGLSENEKKAKERICLALDFPSVKEALDLVSELSDYVGIFKVGKQLHTIAGNEGIDIIKKIHEKGGKIFLDLKLHDKPSTVYEASKACAVPGVCMFNIHVAGGEVMCKKAIEGSLEGARINKIESPKVIGVTVLTSLDDGDLAVQGLGINYGNLVRRRTELAKEWGLDGVVCPANKAGVLEKEFGSNFIYVTPGIEWAGKSGEGQKQLYTPDRAVQDCTSSILVIGSAIRKAEDRRKVAYEILQAMAKNL